VAGRSGRTGDVPLSGFSLADLEALALGREAPLRDLLEELQAAGLELIAEAPLDLLRSARRSIEEVNIAGLGLARLTLHQSPPGSAVALFQQVEALQREVGVIRTFAPLPRAVNPVAPSTGYDDITRVALARLAIGGVDSIQVDWSRYGPKLAQVALTVGADDLDAVSAVDEEREGRRRAPLAEVIRNIQAAGLTPAERNGRFDLLPR
jgi:aminodeoxyfutalosine synthase